MNARIEKMEYHPSNRQNQRSDRREPNRATGRNGRREWIVRGRGRGDPNLDQNPNTNPSSSSNVQSNPNPNSSPNAQLNRNPGYNAQTSPNPSSSSDAQSNPNPTSTSNTQSNPNPDLERYSIPNSNPNVNRNRNRNPNANRNRNTNSTPNPDHFRAERNGIGLFAYQAVRPSLGFGSPPGQRSTSSDERPNLSTAQAGPDGFQHRESNPIGNGILGRQNQYWRPPRGRGRGSFDRSSSNSNWQSERSIPSHQNFSEHDLIESSVENNCPRPLTQWRQDTNEFANPNRRSSQDWRCCPSPRPNQMLDEEIKKKAITPTERPNLPQLVQEIEEKLSKGEVECMICYDMVARSAAIWSCGSCYSIFHLHCIKKWARAPSSVDLSAGQSQGPNWRCPGCQSVQVSSPEELCYRCFCGQMEDPPVDYYVTPHSCGGPCGKPLDKGKKSSGCPHKCILQCHPGPCPPCTALAPPGYCPCGKTTITRRCSDQKSIGSCGKRCEKPLRCGRHFCDKICHEDRCDCCKVLISASCFCGKKNDVILCGDMEIQGELDWRNGIFACENLCMKMLSCKNHSCGKRCHPGECGECELLPGRVKTCPCGKTQLENQRKSCMDPVPTCLQVCGKQLPCGKHLCRSNCHQGMCGPCLVPVNQKCQCGSSSRTVACCKATVSTEENEEFLCEKYCGQKKNCGRHRCSNRCCRLANQGSSNVHLGDWDPHLCQIPCGKKLRCGQHFCQELCHSGHCPPCLETIFTDLSCACGKTSIPPPLPCGTPVPSCQHPCSIPQPCGHLPTHNCHFGECPPCTMPVAKECVGNHVVLRNVPCGSRDIKCNKLCGKTRQCGMHACSRTCHLPPCDSILAENIPVAKRSCGQPCGAPRRDCRHTCVAPCHPSAPCPDTRCKFPVTITCACGRLTADVPCDAGGNGMRADPIFEASILHKLPAPLQPVEQHLSRVPLGQRKLACDDECAKLEKKRILADAFDINTNVDGLLPGENGPISEYLAELIRREPQWLSAVEERFKYLVLGRTKTNVNNIRVHVFSPVPKEKRDVLRQLAERWKLSVNIAGWEPKRFLIVHATQKSKPPSRSLVCKGLHPIQGQVQPQSFNPLVDMDPRLVLALFDLPREAEVSTLILRFGGECELVWLNDKNALAIFGDPARAATALRRVDNASVYHGAVIVPPNGVSHGCSAWGTKEGANAGKANPWKKNVRESGWVEDSWGEDWSMSVVSKPVWHIKDNPITTIRNPWGALEKDSIAGETSSLRIHDQPSSKPLRKGASSASQSEVGPSQSNQNMQKTVNSSANEVDDWEKAFE